MGGKIMHVLGCRLAVIDPFMSSHIAHAMEVCAIFDRNARRTDVADEHPRLKDLNFCSSCNCSVDFAAGHEGAGGKNAFDHRLFSNNESPGGVDFAFDTTVDSNGSIKIEDTLEIDSLSEEGEIVVVAGFLSAFVA